MTTENTTYPRFRWLILIIACFGYTGGQINMIVMAPLLPEIAGSLSIDLARAGNFMSFFLLLSSLALIVGGFLCDRLGIMFMLILGLICASLPAVLLPVIGHSYDLVFIARLVQGMSMGFIMCVMAPIVAIWFPPAQKGMASGLMGASISLGAAIGVMAAPALNLILHNWQLTIACLSLVGWVGLGLGLITAAKGVPKPPPSNQSAGREHAPANFRKALFTLFTPIGILLTFFAAWCLQTLYNQTPAFLAAAKPLGAGFGSLRSGQLMLAVMIAGMVGPVIGGLLQDRLCNGRPQAVMLLGFIICTLSIYPLQWPALQESVTLMVIFLALAGTGIQFVFPGITVLVSKSYPVEIVGKFTGLWFGIGTFGGAIGLFLGNLAVARQGDFSGAITLMAAGAMMGGILVMLISRLTTPAEEENSLLPPAEGRESVNESL